MGRMLVIIVMVVFGTAALAHPTHARRHARAQHRHWSAEMHSDGQTSSRAYHAVPSQQARPRPSLERRFDRKGAVATVGYNPGVIGRTLGPHELDGAAEARLGQSESIAGVNVRVPF